MKITWLGQAGLMFETDGKIIMIDPYLSDSVKEIEPQNYRRVPVDESFLTLAPDIIILTHNHLDHTDPETLKHYLENKSGVLVLASGNAWQNVRKLFPFDHNYVQFNEGTSWTEGNVKFSAVHAEHSDECAIGVIIEAGGKKYYVTGDTLYNTKIFDRLPCGIDAVFVPVNGVGNNMNFADGCAFCEKIGAVAVPIHCGLFDNKKLSDFPYKNKVVPQFFKEIVLTEV